MEAEERMKIVNLLYDVVLEAVKKFGSFIKAAVVFGSFARKEDKPNDVDLLFIVDDSFAPLDPKLWLFYQDEMKRIAREKGGKNLHINTVTISQFWDSVRRGDPLAIQVLRDGVPIIDQGFFAPLKRLLQQGKIRPTEEAIEAAKARSFANLNAYQMHLINAANSLYWAAVEAAHAAVMKFGKVPASPRELAKYLRELLVSKGLISEEDVQVYERAYEIMKALTRGEKKTVSLEELEELYSKVSKFVVKLADLVEGVQNDTVKTKE